MKDEISLSAALEIINRKDKNGEAFPFDISVRTLNRNSKSGGKLNVYNGAKLLINESNSTPGKARLLDNVLVGETVSRSPNHWRNKTKNISLDNGKIVKIHLRLIISINNKKVVY